MLVDLPGVIDLAPRHGPLEQPYGIRILVGSGGLREIVGVIVIEVVGFLQERAVPDVLVEGTGGNDRQSGYPGTFNVRSMVD